MKSLVPALFLLAPFALHAQQAPSFQPVPELPYRVLPAFFELPHGLNFGEAASVAVNPQGHIFLFQRVEPMLSEYDPQGRFLRSLGAGLFTTPHGLRIDREGNLWTTDVGSHVVLKLSPEGRVLMVLGHKGQAAEADWLFNRPADVAFDSHGNIYIADGYGNSRIVKFSPDGQYLLSWGAYGTAPGQFRLPHSVVVDRDDHVFVGDRENARIQIFTPDGKFLREWTDIGYPYGLALLPNGHLLMADGGFDRIVELDAHGKIVGALGSPGHLPGQFAWAHNLAVSPDHRLFVADTLNWRFQAFAPTPPTGKLAPYVPSTRLFDGSKPSSGWVPHQTGAVK